ncbi:MAG: transcriptional repressor LexA [Patescibacteria group bacterium]
MPVVLYKRQREIVEFIRKYIATHQYSPTIAEISEAMGTNSPATVHEHLKVLEKKGVIARAANGVRGIEIVEPEFLSPILLDEKELPLLGYIAAGKPLEPYSDPNATFAVPKNLIPAGKQAFVLKVKGESMVDDGIFDGDFVIILKQETANNGDIVVALLKNGLATLKKFFKEENQIRLEPANSKMAPIYATEVMVQGKLVALVRRYS